MKNLEIAAKTVEEATQKALTQLNVGLDKVEITVLSEGKSGILGIGAEDARISVRLLDSEEEDETEAIDKAKTVLENLLNLMGVQASIEVQTSQLINDGEEGNPVILNVTGEETGNLIGRLGQTIDSIQYIVRLITSKKTRSKTPIIIDVQNYKRRRYDDLRTLAVNVASQVKARKSSIRLEPMPPFERRIVHLTLADDPDVATESIGEGESRKVVVYPKAKK